LKVQISRKLTFLIREKSRYKVAYGGRGAGKSWSFADCLLALAQQKQIRVLCCREIQNSIKDSVHRLFRDRIEYYKVDPFFEITDNEIRGKNGSLFIFKGLRTNVSEIKSMEGIDYCWVEEAHKVSDESWEILIPTIRKEESEIWISFNTGQVIDPVYKRFVAQKRPDCIVALINYWDNPWFPDVLEKEMVWDKENNPARYRHVWCGEPGVEGQFFVEFGPHLKEKPFEIQNSDLMGRLFGSLDSGTTHPTAFGLLWVSPDVQYYNDMFGGPNTIHRLLTYQQNGMDIASHAHAIKDKLQSFPHTRGIMPDVIWADPAMWTKVKLNERMVRSQIDEYIDAFANTGVRFVRANNDKHSGCQIMKMAFRVKDGVPGMRYWEGYNQSFVEGIGQVETDKNDAEIYAKQDGDDICDEARYGLVGVRSWVSSQEQSKKNRKVLREVTKKRNDMNWKAM